MPTLLTPVSLLRHAELYEQWSTLLASGMPMLRALAILRRSRFARRYRGILERVGARLDQGESLPEALAPESRAFPRLDLVLLRAGDRSGRLEVCLKELSVHYRRRATWLRQTLGACAYPVLVLGVALIVFPVDLWVTVVTKGDWTPLLSQKLRVLAWTGGGVAAAIMLAAARPRRTWIQGIAERLASWVPLLGAALHERALARLTLALEALLNAGTGTVEAWPVAAEASGSIRLQSAIRRRHASLESGHPVSETLASSRLFPDLFTDAYQIGETSGKMEDTLRRLQSHYDESASHKLNQLAFWVPRLLYLGMLVYVALNVIGFWKGYWAQFDSLL